MKSFSLECFIISKSDTLDAYIENDIYIRKNNTGEYYLLAEEIKRELEYRNIGKHYSDRKRVIGRDEYVVKNTFVRMYFTDKPCKTEDADACLLNSLEGRLFLDISLTGYSEYTITGYDVNRCMIGNHDLIDIVSQHMREYMVLVFEFPDEI